MSTTPRHMHLGAFLFGVGHHLAAWRHPDVDPAGAASLSHYLRLAPAEAAKFDRSSAPTTWACRPRPPGTWRATPCPTCWSRCSC
jgi:hypothetical protein